MPYKVTLTVKESRGDCPYYQVGDRIIFRGGELLKDESGRLCLYALSAMFPYITALTRDTPEEDWINRKKSIQCPDDARPVIFQVSRERV